MDQEKADLTGKKFDDKLSIPELEGKVIEFWEKDGTFRKILENTKNGKPFTFYDGPPFATGLPHYGHILASTIKDLIPRYQSMKGHFVRRRWGWDCHGLPIEEIVEKKLGISGKKQIEEIGIKKFNETCRSMVLEFADEWGKMVKRMGRWIEFENSYKTMDQTFMESVWWSFKQIYDKGLVYEGRKVLLYCPRCETPISNFEVAMDNSYKDVVEESAFVKFKVVGLENTYFLAWTTTPWTLPGNVALAVGKDIDYVKAEKEGEVVIVAKELQAKVLKEEYRTIEEMKGSALVGLAYEPLFAVPAVQSEKTFKVYPADFVTTEDGTGIVHTAVVYGEDDYKLGLEVGLPVVPLLDEKGVFNADSPEIVRGKYFKDSESWIKKDLESRGLLFRRLQYPHSYPHCWRCGTSLYYNAIPAWFINIQKVKPELLRTNKEEINWFPGHLKHGRYEKSVEVAPDWNISRNRYWGNPIPIWKCTDCEKPTAVGSISDIKEKSLKRNEFIFGRHGNATHNVDNLCGPQDLSEYTSHLTPMGIEEAEKTAVSLKGKKIDLIIASPLARIRETVAIIRKHVDAPVEYLEELRDVDCGGLRKHSEWEAIRDQQADPLAVPFPGGESHNDAKGRYVRALKEIDLSNEGKTILIIGHGGPLWSLQGALKGLTNEEVLKSPYPATGEIYDFEWKPLPLNDKGEVDLHRPYIDTITLRCDHCGGKAKKIAEIFDSWVEAGSMPFSEYHYPFENKEIFESRFPAQFVAEYIAQTRAWFYVMHVISFINFGHAPFENVVTTGTILAEDGSKMSKSKNNYPDPWIVINKYGVDTLRFYLMNAVVMQADNLNFSLKDMESVHRKVVLILWNVYQYFMTYTPTGPLKDADVASSNILDRWMIAKNKELVLEVTKYLDEYDTVRASRLIEKYVDDLSTWYLRRSRGREDAGFFPTFYKTLETVSKVIAPFMPHLAEAIYQNLGAKTEASVESVHLAGWPVVEELTAEDKEVLAGMAVVREASSLALGLRKQANMPVRQPLPKLSLSVKISEELSEILSAELNVKEIGLGELSGEGIISWIPETEGLKLWLDTNLTDELRLEGLVRNLERFVQEMRKAQGFKVGEEAILKYSSEDLDIEKAFTSFDSKKTYISKIEKVIAPLSDSGDFDGRAKISITK